MHTVLLGELSSKGAVPSHGHIRMRLMNLHKHLHPGSAVTQRARAAARRAAARRAAARAVVMNALPHASPVFLPST